MSPGPKNESKPDHYYGGVSICQILEFTRIEKKMRFEWFRTIFDSLLGFIQITSQSQWENVSWAAALKVCCVELEMVFLSVSLLL